MSQLKFGDYISVEQKRFGAPNEHYTHKVIRMLQSNSWAEVPALTAQKSTLHKSIEDVVDCICCGVDESEVVRYRLSDVKFLRSDAHDKEMEISAYQLSQQNIINAFGISGEGAHSKLVIEYVHGLVIEYVHGLVAENRALKASQGEIYDYTQQFTNSDDREMWNAMHDIYKLSSPLETPATDAAIAELRAQGVGGFAADMWKRGNELVAEGAQKSLVVQVRLAAKLPDTYVDNLRAGRKG